eukprot:scaffold180_cov311-Pinguiococcus_pyrenoidosus.AAC.20
MQLHSGSMRHVLAHLALQVRDLRFQSEWLEAHHAIHVLREGQDASLHAFELRFIWRLAVLDGSICGAMREFVRSHGVVHQLLQPRSDPVEHGLQAGEALLQRQRLAHGRHAAHSVCDCRSRRLRCQGSIRHASKRCFRAAVWRRRAGAGGGGV